MNNERRLAQRITDLEAVNVYILFKYKDGTRNRIQFKPLNMSQGGICLRTDQYPFVDTVGLDGKLVPYHMVITVAETNGKVINMHHMNAYRRHTTNGNTGFAITKKVKNT